MRPGVATMMWTVLYRRIMSSLRDVPPVVTMQCRPMCLPISLTMAEVCNASSRVGMRIKTGFVRVGGHRDKYERQKAC